MPPLPQQLDFGRGPLPPSAMEGAEEEEVVGEAFSMESIYDSLVVDEDDPQAPPSAAPQQQFPPWFQNVPGYTAQQLADLIWQGRLPPQVEALLRARQQQFMAQLGVAGSSPATVQPPQPSAHLLDQQRHLSQSDETAQKFGSRSDLFDRHHHTNLVYWKRNFKHMTADEIDQLVTQQRMALRFSTYAEDYHYQQTAARLYANQPPPKTAPPLTGIHRPICMEPLDAPPRTVPPELNVGVLGKIVFSSLKRPRPLVQIDVPTSQAGPERLGSSPAVAALDSGTWQRRHLLEACEDGLLLALLLADLGSVVPQLPSHEQPVFLAQQQALVAALVQVLNACVGPSVLPSLLQISKGRQLLARSLQILPVAQRLATLMVLLRAVPLLLALPPSALAAHLAPVLLATCNSLATPSALDALHTFARVFPSAPAFADAMATPFGAAILASLLAALRRGAAPPAAQWEPILIGLLNSVVPSLPSILPGVNQDHPIFAAVLHLFVLGGQEKAQWMVGSITAPLAMARDSFAAKKVDLPAPLAQLLVKVGLS